MYHRQSGLCCDCGTATAIHIYLLSGMVPIRPKMQLYIAGKKSPPQYRYEELGPDLGPEISPVLELTKTHSELTNLQRVQKATKVIGGITYVPRHMVRNAVSGKTPSQLGLDVPTIFTLLEQAGFGDETFKKDETLRSNGALRSLLRKHFKKVCFWCSHPGIGKKEVARRVPCGRHYIKKHMMPEPREEWYPKWQRDLHPENRRAERDGLYVET